MRYEIIQQDPPEGYDEPSEDVLEVLDAVLGAPGVWFKVVGPDEELEEAFELALEALPSLSLETFMDVDANAVYLKAIISTNEPVSDD